MLALILLMTATPLSSPGEWIATEDYPKEALNSGIEGIVDFSLSVAKDGNVSDCIILQSSGSDVLDKETCSLLTVRARFEPAETSSTYQSRVSWKIPPAPKMGLETQGVYALANLTPEGTIADCLNGAIGKPTEAGDLCEVIHDSEVMKNLLGDNKLDVAQIELRMFMKPAALPDPSTISIGSDLLKFELAGAKFAVDNQGFGRECEVYSTKLTPADFGEFCDSFDLEQPDFVTSEILSAPTPMQFKLELVITPRSAVQKAGAIQKN